MKKHLDRFLGWLLTANQRNLFDPRRTQVDAAVAIPAGLDLTGTGQCPHGTLIAQKLGDLAKQRCKLQLVASGGKFIPKGPSEAKASMDIWRQAGIPEDRLHGEFESRDTAENAIKCRPILCQLGCQTVVLYVVGWQSRRALACFRRRMPQLTFYYCPITSGDWADNAQPGLRSPYRFALREIAATIYFKLRRWS